MLLLWWWQLPHISLLTWKILSGQEWERGEFYLPHPQSDMSAQNGKRWQATFWKATWHITAACPFFLSGSPSFTNLFSLPRRGAPEASWCTAPTENLPPPPWQTCANVFILLHLNPAVLPSWSLRCLASPDRLLSTLTKLPSSTQSRWLHHVHSHDSLTPECNH